ncbi:MAG: NAD-dependent epimerase/dehydratase family protein [Candidatus Omnitrophica bacterium]|nr:NAD-dependent epimerase/dehydratase family protein [Candidatus Omnitrophota bacterium]
MSKRVLIIGINGYLGNALQAYLKKNARSVEVFGISRNPVNIKNTFSCNCLHQNKLRAIIRDLKPDIIFHLVGGRLKNQERLFKANFDTTLNLFQAVEQIENYKPRIIIPGTAAEYGSPKGKRLLSEKSRCRPVSWYGFVKHLQTLISLDYAKHGQDIMVARMFNIVGGGVPEPLAFGKFAKDIVLVEQKKIPPQLVTKNLSGKRDFCDIDDVCRALWLIAQKGKKGQIYNICSGRSSNILALLKQMLKCSRVKNIAIREVDQFASESFDVVGSYDKLQRLTGWKPRVSLKRSLQNTLQFYRKHI